ncbi:uncharacterized protein LOC143489469 [Brachyhypopomus gauderio]|uniref:uncharacterized protein LOC143489469 n=1 Tax=Brachyhypopomus gauderio TaxID=698409 RepID=UPI00404104F0
MLTLWSGLLLSHLTWHVQSLLTCTDTQYKWPIENSTKCCNMCEPGYFMKTRCEDTDKTQCEACPPNKYMDIYNNELECLKCTQCTKTHMVYKEKCTNISNAICGCESGYELHGTECKQVFTTLATPSTVTKTTQQQTTSPPLDSVWISVGLCCACVCILFTCFILISRHTSACGRILSASSDCLWATKKSSAESSQCTEDEDVPMPVQEVCGKIEYQEKV